MKLTRLATFRWFISIGFLFALLVLIMSPYIEMSPEESRQFLLVIGGCSVVLGMCTLIVLVSKTVVTDSSVRTYLVIGSKSVDFEEIQSVGFTRFFGGQVILQGARSTVRVPLMSTGAAEFVEKLTEKLGRERNGAAVQALAEQKRQFDRL